MYFIYILYSVLGDRYYIGYSTDPIKRLEQHNNPIHPKFTSKYIPWQIVKPFEDGHSKTTALKVERFNKKQKSRKFIGKIVEKDNIYFITQKFHPASDC